MSTNLLKSAFIESLKYIAKRPRSIASVREYLAEKLQKYSSESTEELTSIIEQTIEELKNRGYLNDKDFAEYSVKSQLSRSTIGQQKLRQYLIQQKIDTSTVNEVLGEAFESTSEKELLDKAIAKHVRLRGFPTKPQEVKRLISFLLRRGFSPNLVYSCVRSVLGKKSPDDDFIEDEA